jgi:hypothetical protein
MRERREENRNKEKKERTERSKIRPRNVERLETLCECEFILKALEDSGQPNGKSAEIEQVEGECARRERIGLKQRRGRGNRKV